MSVLSEPFHRLQARWPFLRQIDMGLIVGLAVAVLCYGVFISTAEDVTENDPIVQIDHEIAQELHQQGLQTPNAIALYKVISFIGLPGVWVMGLAVGLVFLWRRQYLTLLIWGITLVGGILLNNAIKSIFLRARPVFADPFVLEQDTSFPSGHAMIAVIGYGLLAYFLCLGLQHRVARILVVFGTILFVILVGISRMALGAHFFSDVIGGFAAGGVWLTLSITVLDQLARLQLRQDAQPKAETQPQSPG